MAKRILVFGAAGFIGTYLIDVLLKHKHRVFASDISPIGEKYYRKYEIPYIPVNITRVKDFNKLPHVRYDAVIHLAALQPANFTSASYNLDDYIKINVLGTLNILEFCRKNKAGKIIYACSHRNTSGLWAKNKPVREEDGRAVQYGGEYSMFSISESAAQDCIEFYRVNYGIKSIIFRLPPVYGYGPHLEIFKKGKPVKTGFQTFIENAVASMPLEIWGDASRGRDIIYVKDVVEAFLKAISNRKAEGLFNIASGYYLTLREEVETIAKVFWGNDTNPVIIPKPDMPLEMDSFLYNNSKARKELGWKPKYHFEKMLYDYIKEMKSDRFGYLLKKRKKMFRENQVLP